MGHAELSRHASLVFCLHAPLRGTLGECLARWAKFDPTTQTASYLVIEGEEPGSRQTIASEDIANLAARTLNVARKPR